MLFFGEIMLTKIKFSKLFAICLLIFLIGCQTSEFSVVIENDQLFVNKGDISREIRFIDNRWCLRYDFDDKSAWSPVWTPFEAKYNSDSKFIFTSGGKIFWVNNDKTSVKEVRFLDGGWKFKSEITEEWKMFD